jgi:Zn-dependent protease
MAAISPESANPLPREEIIAVIGATPVTKKGFSWIPLSQITLWIIFSRGAAKQKPESSILHWAAEGFFKMAAVLSAEWGHNLAHLAASNLIGKPMDELRIQAGMPRCVYQDINDRLVTPRQHIIRSLGGPIFNGLLLPITAVVQKMTRTGSIAGETAKTAFQTNLFLSLISLLPIPGIDGGPLLKWNLVTRGYTIQEADQTVQEINGPLALCFGLFSSWAFYSKKILTGIFGTLLGLTSLSIFAGWIKEEDVSIKDKKP